MLKPEFFRHEELAELSPAHRLLFAGLWCLADRNGRLRDRPKQIKLDIMPWDTCDMNTLLGDLHTHGFIVRYRVGDENYLWIRSFERHQRPHPNEPQSEIPAYDAATASTNGTSTSTNGGSPSDNVKPTPPDNNNGLQNTNEGPPKVDPPDHNSEFLTMVRPHYPARSGHQKWKEAQARFVAHRKKGQPLDDIIAGVKGYAAHCVSTGIAGTERVSQATTFFGPGMLWTEWMSGWSPEIQERRPGYSESGLPIRDYCERCKTTFWEHEGHQCEAGVAA